MKEHRAYRIVRIIKGAVHEVHYRLTRKGFEFNLGARISFIPLRVDEGCLGDPRSNVLFTEAEHQLGECDLIPL